MSDESLAQVQAAVDATEAIYREQLLGQRDNRVCASLNSPNGPIILGWDKQGLPQQWTDLDQLHPMQRQNVESYSASPHRVRSTRFDVFNLGRIAPMTDYADRAGQAITDRVNFIVTDDQEQERPFSVDELTALRSIAFAPHFQEGFQQIGDSIQSLPIATDMYCFLIPQNGSGVAILPQPYKDTAGDSNAGAYEETSRTIISELIINDILQKRTGSDTGLYLEDALAVLPISTGRQDIDALLKWVKKQDNVQDAIRRAEDRTGTIGRWMNRTGLATVFSTSYIKQLIAHSLIPSIRNASIQNLRELALRMAERAEQTFQPDHIEDHLVSPDFLDPDPDKYKVDWGKLKEMSDRASGEEVPGPGYYYDPQSEQIVPQPGTRPFTGRLALEGMLSVQQGYGYDVENNRVVLLKGYTVNTRDDIEIAPGFEMGKDDKPHLIDGYVWNPNTRTAELFV